MTDTLIDPPSTPVADVVALAPEILAGKVRGRIVLELG